MFFQWSLEEERSSDMICIIRIMNLKYSVGVRVVAGFRYSKRLKFYKKIKKKIKKMWGKLCIKSGNQGVIKLECDKKKLF